MVARTLWLWLSICWLTEAVLSPQHDVSLRPIQPSARPSKPVYVFPRQAYMRLFYVLPKVELKESLLDVSFSSISIANCFHVHVSSNALKRLKGLQQVAFGNVKQITLEEEAFNWTTNNPHIGLVITIFNCNIQQIPSYSFKGNIKDILLSSVNISRINTYAFGSIDHAGKIDFNKVNVLEAETQSFKRVSVEFLTVLDSNFIILPEKMMTDVTVHQEVRFDKVKIGRMKRSSLKINSSRNFRIIKCTIGFVESNAFDLRTKGDVSIHENVFSHLESHAFAGIHVEEKYLREAGKQDFVFENNTLIAFENESLQFNTSSFDPRLDWVMLKQKCSCDSVKSWTDNLVVYSSNGFPKGNLPPVDRLVYCLNPKPTRLSDFQRLYCNVSRFSVLTVAVVVVLVVTTLSVIFLVVYCGVRKRGKKYINVPTAASTLRPPEDNKAHMLVVPDGKTYRETELHVIFEHAESIKTTNFVKGRPDNDTND